MKKLTAVVLAIIMICIGGLSYASGTNIYDANSDGRMNTADAVTVLRACAGM